MRTSKSIKNGDRVEVLTSANSKGPSRDWLNIVKSTQAKNKINQWFRSELKEENILHGKELINNYAKAKGINFGEINKPEYQGKIIRKYGFHDWNSCLATVGHGGLKESQIVNRMYDEYRKDHPITLTDQEVLEAVGENKQEDMPKHSKSGIVVKGLYDVAVHFSKCCSPVPGDEIVGFVTRGRGVSIHRTDCVNILHLSVIWSLTSLFGCVKEVADKGQEASWPVVYLSSDKPQFSADEETKTQWTGETIVWSKGDKVQVAAKGDGAWLSAHGKLCGRGGLGARALADVAVELQLRYPVSARKCMHSTFGNCRGREVRRGRCICGSRRKCQARGR